MDTLFQIVVAVLLLHSPAGRTATVLVDHRPDGHADSMPAAGWAWVNDSDGQ